jgi:glycosyltransferase involved in cell wall biosynthesis
MALAPLPYYTPIFNSLAEKLDLHVLFMSSRAPLTAFRDPWGQDPRFEHSFWWSRTLELSSLDFRAQVSLGVSPRLQRLRPDVLIAYSWHPIMYEPLVWSSLTGRRAVMWSESCDFSGLLRGRFSQAVRRFALRRCQAFVTSGTKASEYLLSLGVPESRLITSCMPAGTPPHDGRGPEGPRQRRAGEVRYLFVGRLIPRKRPLELLRAFARIRAELPNATLTVVGEGPLLGEVSREAERLGEGVRVLGHAEGPDLSRLYTDADVLVIPSVREVWGVVVNEALLHGLYVVATDQVASAFDLLGPGSGAIVPADDASALVRAMVDASRAGLDDADRSRRAARAARCSVDAFAKDIHRAVRLALEGPPAALNYPHRAAD